MSTTKKNLNVNTKEISKKKTRISQLKDFLNFLFLIVMTSNLTLAQSEEIIEGINNNLVNVYWLEKNLDNESIIIFDASPAQIYTANHIPGALNYDIFNYGPRELPIGEVEKSYQSWGISPEKKIVIYDQGGTFLATRLFFSLYYYGFPENNLFVLDGGLTKWVGAGLPVTNEITHTGKKGTFTIKNLNEEVAPQLTEFLSASGDLENNVLLEALDPDWHFGGMTFFEKPGHIPNAIMTPSSDYFNSDKTFKSPEEIGKMMTYFGIRPEQTIYSHCGGGIAASVPFFALKFILKYPKVKLYRGSQLEWISDQRGLPIWTYDTPFIMREASWLKFWGGKTARMFGISNVTILDVRSEKEFNEGHLPFAINIPFEKFKKNVNQPEKLAEALIVAGINTTEEAVIVSGKGLSEESALAFIMLERLGQKKVSIFMDEFENWTQLGFTLIIDTMNSQSKQSVDELINNPKLNTLNIKDDIIVNDVMDKQGIYPKIFIVSEDKMVLKDAGNKVVHLPYNNLLNENGRPKAANEIWKVFDDAGVPRYAELVCISENPEASAINYFILKLMGYPDVKVLVN